MSRSPLDPALLKFPHVVSAREHAALRIDDLSARPRFGCKGPGAPAWLAANGYSVPDGANSARLDAQGILVARLATSEFLIEAISGGAQTVAASLQQLAWPTSPSGLHHRLFRLGPWLLRELTHRPFRLAHGPFQPRP